MPTNAKTLDELFASEDPADLPLLEWVLTEMQQHLEEKES